MLDRRALPAIVYVLVPIGAAILAFRPILGAYFFGDDFTHLSGVINEGVWSVAWRPHGGHFYAFPIFSYWGLWRLFGPRPEAFFACVLCLHVLNVVLFMWVARLLTGSLRLASVSAVVWGTLPYHGGVLGWFCVWGQVLVATALLVVVAGLVRSEQAEAPVDVRAALGWAGIVLVASLSFGMGIALAGVLPVLVVGWRGRAAVRPAALGILVALPVLVAGAYLVACLSDPTRVGGEAMGILRTAAAGPALVLAMWGHLLLYGLGGVALGTRWWPVEYPSPAVGVVGAVVAVGLVTLAFREPARWTRRVAGITLVAVAFYGFVAFGRASMLVDVVGFSMSEAARTDRYHYAASAALALVLVLVVARLARLAPRSEWARDLLWGTAIAVLVAGFGRNGRPVNLHDDSRSVAERLLAEATAAARAAAPGATVYLPDRRAPLLVWGTVTRAQLFSVLHATDEIDGRRIRFVQPDPRIVATLPPGSLLARLTVTPEQARPTR